MENLCESCVYWKKRHIANCQIQQVLHTNDITNQTHSMIIECKKYHEIKSDKSDYVEIRAKYDLRSLGKYTEWTKVTRFLAIGLQGIEIREIPNGKE